MDSALSEEEFHRMQVQLIELKTEKYTLADKCKRQDAVIKDLQTKSEQLEKEHQRALKAVSKSKKAREFDMLIQENDGLQRKLQSQEEEFRLQNATLMKELSNYANQLDEYEKQQQQSETPAVTTSTDTAELSRLQNEITRLTAENSALQKNIGEVKSKFETELNLLRSAVEGVDITDSSPSSSKNADAGTTLSNLIQESELLSKYNEVKVELDTERAEKDLLKTRLTDLEKNSSLEAMEQLKDKLKKKQESYVRIQQEKESQFKEQSEKILFLEEARTRDSNNFRIQIEKLNEEIKTIKQMREESEHKLQTHINDQEQTIANLKSKINEASQKLLEQLKSENEKQKDELSKKTAILTEQQSTISSNQQIINQSETSITELRAELEEINSKLSNTEQKFIDVSQVAEKRKKLLDELAIKSQKDSDTYKQKLSDLETSRKQELDALVISHRAEIDEFETQLREERRRSSELEQCRSDVDKLNDDVRSLEETKSWLQRTLTETEETLNSERLKFTEEQTTTQREQEQQIEQMKQNQISETQTLNEQIETLQSELIERREEIENLTQKVQDNVQDMKLHERKGASLMKDLKKQLVQERKRADKLEKRLEEVITEAKIKQPAEPFHLPNDMERLSTRADDTSSVSSWSGANFSGVGSSLFNAIRSHDQPVNESTPRGSPTANNIEHDVNTLLPIVQTLQKEKSHLTERVSILEESNSAMADDLLQKQSIIDHYSMDSKERMGTPSKSRHHKDDPVSLKQIVQFVKNKGDDSQKEKLRITQRMLEETLTKNMNLQRDIEVLVSQLSSQPKSNSESSST